MADDVLLVARPGNTHRKDLRITRELLEHVSVVPTGMVIVGSVGPTHGGYYGYGAKASPTVRQSSVTSLEGQTLPGRRSGSTGDRLDILP
jgi:hypothetical protein